MSLPFAESAAPVPVDAVPSSPKLVSSKPSPFCLRLTAEERAYLENLAGDKPLGTYMREVLLVEHTSKRRTMRKPKADQQQLALVLATLGDTRMASNLNQLAHHANMGTLPVSRNVERELEDAYKAILIMRDTLLMALGLRSGGGSS